MGAAGEGAGSSKGPAAVPLAEFHSERTRDLRSLQVPPRLASAKALQGGGGGGHVLYWMKTAVRGHENPALDVAKAQAAAWGVPLVCVAIAFTASHTHPTQRRLTWLLQGLRDTQLELRTQGLELFVYLEGNKCAGEGGPLDAWALLGALCSAASLVVTEEMPTPPYAGWNQRLVDAVETEVWGVDTACIYPMRLNKTCPVKAYTYRSQTKAPRLQRLDKLPYSDKGARWAAFLEGACVPDPPQSLPESLGQQPASLNLQSESLDLASLLEGCEGVDHSVPSVAHICGGSREAYARWEHWRAHEGLKKYANLRNTAMKREGVSRMSAYLHYGMVSPFKLARDGRAEGSYGANKFLDEFFTWRGIAHAFCFHSCPVLETLQGLPQWAQDTLQNHAGDPRDLKSDAQLDSGTTGDALWDAMQHQLVTTGELHNNSRMTWGKMVVAWTPSPQHALATLCRLNHRYALDGCDPCSYGGILWCLGLFDRPMAAESTPVFGRLRQRSTRQIAGRLSAAAYRALPVSPFRGEDNSQQSLRAVLSKAGAATPTKPAKQGAAKGAADAAGAGKEPAGADDDLADEDWEAVEEAAAVPAEDSAEQTLSAQLSAARAQRAQQAQQARGQGPQARRTPAKRSASQQGGGPGSAGGTPKRKQATLDGLFRKAAKT